MKIRHLITPLILSTLTMVYGQQKEDSISGKLTFKNGNSISGTVSQWTADNITLTSPNFLEPVTFSVTNLANIINESPRSQYDYKADNNVTIKIKRFTSVLNVNRIPQDSIVGKLTEINATHVTVKSPFAGILKVKRSDIEQIEFLHGNDTLYQGPNDIEEWENSLPKFNSWKIKNNSLVSGSNSGLLSKNLKLPDAIHVKIDGRVLSKRGKFYMNFFASSHKVNPKHHYRFTLSSQTLNIKKTTQLGAINLQETKSSNSFNMIKKFRKHETKIDLYLNKQTGTFTIFLDGQLYSTFKDIDPKPKDYGSSIQLFCTPNADAIIDYIAIYKWNGHLPSRSSSRDPILGKGTTINMVNGDTIVGELGNSTQNEISVKTDLTTLKTKTNGMRRIFFGTKMLPAQKDDHVTLWIDNQKAIRVRVLGYNGNKLKVSHPSFGEAEFDFKYFNKIVN